MHYIRSLPRTCELTFNLSIVIRSLNSIRYEGNVHGTQGYVILLLAGMISFLDLFALTARVISYIRSIRSGDSNFSIASFWSVAVLGKDEPSGSTAEYAGLVVEDPEEFEEQELKTASQEVSPVPRPRPTPIKTVSFDDDTENWAQSAASDRTLFNHLRNQSVHSDETLHDLTAQMTEYVPWYRKFGRAAFATLERVLVFAGFMQLLTGIVVYTGGCRGMWTNGCLAHLIKGGIFWCYVSFQTLRCRRFVLIPVRVSLHLPASSVHSRNWVGHGTVSQLATAKMSPLQSLWNPPLSSSTELRTRGWRDSAPIPGTHILLSRSNTSPLRCVRSTPLCAYKIERYKGHVLVRWSCWHRPRIQDFPTMVGRRLHRLSTSRSTCSSEGRTELCRRTAHLHCIIQPIRRPMHRYYGNCNGCSLPALPVPGPNSRSVGLLANRILCHEVLDILLPVVEPSKVDLALKASYRSYCQLLPRMRWARLHV